MGMLWRVVGEKSLLDLVLKSSYVGWMKSISQLKGGIYEVYFRYTTELEGYANSSSDIIELGAIPYINWVEK